MADQPTPDEIDAVLSHPELESFVRHRVSQCSYRVLMEARRIVDVAKQLLNLEDYTLDRMNESPDYVTLLATRNNVEVLPARICIVIYCGRDLKDGILNEVKSSLLDSQAEKAFLVSWPNVDSQIKAGDISTREFRIIDGRELLEIICNFYPNFTEDLKADIPLKRLWVLLGDAKE